MKDQWDYVLSVLEELGGKKLFLKYQSSTDIFNLVLLLLPSIFSNDHPTNIGSVELTPKIILDSPELNCSVVFSLYCLRVSKKTDYFLRDLVRRERGFSWFNDQSTFFHSSEWCSVIQQFLSFVVCFCLGSGCHNSHTRLWRLFFRVDLQNFRVVVIWINHLFIWSMRNSGPRLRIIFLRDQILISIRCLPYR